MLDNQRGYEIFILMWKEIRKLVKITNLKNADFYKKEALSLLYNKNLINSVEYRVLVTNSCCPACAVAIDCILCPINFNYIQEEEDEPFNDEDEIYFADGMFLCESEYGRWNRFCISLDKQTKNKTLKIIDTIIEKTIWKGVNDVR
jgi:hypothetical protein